MGLCENILYNKLRIVLYKLFVVSYESPKYLPFFFVKRENQGIYFAQKHPKINA
jgi:hypothetical protein